jgi:hypothetical protein
VTTRRTEINVTASIGLALSVGDGERTSSVDLAPAARDGQALVAIWAGDHEEEPAPTVCRTTERVGRQPQTGLCSWRHWTKSRPIVASAFGTFRYGNSGWPPGV